jgi:hypothetical protein
LQSGQRPVRRAAGSEPPDVVEHVRRERLPQAQDFSSGERRDVDDAVADHHAEAGLAVGDVTRELHGL